MHRNAIANWNKKTVVDQNPIIHIFQANIEPAPIQPTCKAVSTVKPAI